MSILQKQLRFLERPDVLLFMRGISVTHGQDVQLEPEFFPEIRYIVRIEWYKTSIEDYDEWE